MKKTRLGMLLTIGATAVLLMIASSVQASVQYNAKDLAGPPPASLDQYFPPNSPAPMYLIEMFNLAGPFEAIGIHLQEGDPQYMKPSFDIFRSQYDNVSQMVPEWTKAFPEYPVTNLGKAIDSGDPAKIGQAMGAVGQICSDCHLVYQVKVQQKYHWRDFDSVTVIDPVSSTNMTFGDYMTAMAGNFEGALADLQVHETDKAKDNFQDFQQEFATFKSSCEQCHVNPATGLPIPRAYYVDDVSQNLVNLMGLAVNAGDAASAGALGGAIGNGICFNCHLVHMPAQIAKDIWSQYGKILK